MGKISAMTKESFYGEVMRDIPGEYIRAGSVYHFTRYIGRRVPAAKTSWHCRNIETTGGTYVAPYVMAAAIKSGAVSVMAMGEV